MSADAKELRERESYNDAMDNIYNKLDGIDAANSIVAKVSMTAHQSFRDANSPETFYAKALGEDLYNFDQFYAVDAEIERRKKVVSG